MAELQNPLPLGWSCQVDKRSGRCYYINHFTKSTTWDDPRLQNKQRYQPPMAHPMPTEHIILQDLGNIASNSPRTSRLQDTSLSTVVNTEEAVTKISTMFPTVSDTHIRLLLKKYMKYIFPKAEETMILDILSSNDNNIQKASEILIDMGFEKKENVKPSRAIEKPQLPKQEEPQPTIVLKMKTVADKKLIQSKVEAKYTDIPGQVVAIALDSVDFDEQRAGQILDIMVQEENDKVDQANDGQEIQNDQEVTVEPLSGTVPVSQSRQSLKSILRTEKSDYSIKESPSFSRVLEESTDEMDGDFKSPNIIDTNGANRNLVRGANQELLLEDYINWQGPQPRLHQGPITSLAKGPNPSLRKSRTYQACGPNAELRKGPKVGLAKGSIFSQFKGVLVGESRGK